MSDYFHSFQPFTRAISRGDENLQLAAHRYLKRRSLATIAGLLLLNSLLTACDSAGPAAPSAATLIPAAPSTAAPSSPATATSGSTGSGSGTVVPGANVPSGSGTPTGASQAALAYLTYAVDYIKQYALNSDKVDWAAVRKQVFGPDLKAQTTADTYPAITYVLDQLPVNHHSRLITPEQAARERAALASAIGLTASYAQRKVTKVDVGSLAEQAGVHTGDTLVTVNDTLVESLGAFKFYAQLYFGSGVKLGLRRGDNQAIIAQISHDPLDTVSMVQGHPLEGNIGYIALPSIGASPVYSYYAGITQEIIRDIDQKPTCGWVVDLQGNSGGAFPPMLDGIGPVLGEGQVGAFTWAAGSRPWTYRNGQALFGDYVGAQVDFPYHLQRAHLPVAVLTDGTTASAGEAVLVAFRGRPDTRTFGEATFGVPTGNAIIPLSDGAELVLTEVEDADRTGHAYEGEIPPDVPVATDAPIWRGTDKDSVLQAGVDWLKQQPACANH